VIFYSDIKDKEYDNVEIVLAQRLKDFGFFNVKPYSIKNFNHVNLDGVKILMLLHPVERELNQSQILKIKNWVESGGNLIGIGLNLTDATLMNVFGVYGRPKTTFINPSNNVSYLKINQSEKIFSGIKDIVYSPTYGLIFKYGNITGKILSEIYDSSKSTVLGTGIVENNYELGKAYYFGYTVGFTISRITEGRGLSGSGYIKAEHQALLSNPEWNYPIADFHIYPIINLIVKKYPLFSYWVPNGKTSLIAITGDSDGTNDNEIDNWFREIKSYGLAGTAFILNDNYHSFYSYFYSKGMEFGTHRNYGEAYISAKDRMISNSFPKPVSNRNHGLYWNGLVSYPMEMEGCGIQFDSSLEAAVPSPPYNVSNNTGTYGFGSALPYKFFDIQGKSINVLEIPLYYQDSFYTARYGSNTQKMKDSFDEVYYRMKDFKSVGTILLHQNYLYRLCPGYSYFFRYALDKLSRDSSVIVWTMGDIGNWWKGRDWIYLEQKNQTSFILNSTYPVNSISFLTSSSKINFDGVEKTCQTNMTVWNKEWCVYTLDVSKGLHNLVLEKFQ
jgi:hypothetical protein